MRYESRGESGKKLLAMIWVGIASTDGVGWWRGLRKIEMDGSSDESGELLTDGTAKVRLGAPEPGCWVAIDLDHWAECQGMANRIKRSLCSKNSGTRRFCPIWKEQKTFFVGRTPFSDLSLWPCYCPDPHSDHDQCRPPTAMYRK
jgi:hypothetical protein